MSYIKMSDDLKKQWKLKAIRVSVNKNKDAKVVRFDPSIEHQLKRKKGVKYIPTVK